MFLWIDTSTKDELIAARHTIEEIRQLIEADSLAFLSQEGLLQAIGRSNDSKNCGQCLACFTGQYPTRIGGEHVGACVQTSWSEY
ncbi:Amidophosphoribosyltransferase precursor [Anoxybacillus sp. BCO1]|nr:Amidophosphoribosyltransferase precursor [Anoxybacillus sp. BCO1]